MPRMNRAEMVAELAEYGVMAPKEWTVHELEYHLHETRAQEGIQVKKGKSQTSLREHMTALNVAARKKQDLQDHLVQNLKMPPMPNATIMDLKRAAITKIYQISECHPMDPVGFGKHSSLTYQEVAQQYPSYCEWVKKTSMEGDSCLLLQRLASWLEQGTVATSTKVVNPVSKSKKITPEATSSSVETQTLQMLASMGQMLNQLKGEVDSLKEERPRKAPAVSMDAESLGSFELHPAP